MGNLFQPLQCLEHSLKIQSSRLGLVTGLAPGYQEVGRRIRPLFLLQWGTGLCPAPTPAQAHMWGILSRKRRIGMQIKLLLAAPICSEMETQLRWTGAYLRCQDREVRGLRVALCRNPRTWSNAWLLVGAPRLFTACCLLSLCLFRLLLLQQVASGTPDE